MKDSTETGGFCIRSLIISDVHGCLDEFNLLLSKVNYRPQHDELILLGDYVDRGIKSREVVQRVKELHEEFGVVVLKGNHDDMMVNALINNDESLNAHWLNNGGYQTIESYCGFDFLEEQFDWNTYIKAKEFIRNHFQPHIDFLNDLSLYHETDTHIFVHAGINPFYEDWKKQPDDDFLWIRDIFINNLTGTDKIVVFGHTPCVYLHSSADIWFSPLEDKIGVDGACAYGKQLNCLEINHGEYFLHSVKKGESPPNLARDKTICERYANPIREGDSFEARDYCVNERNFKFRED
ncbi:metallophosphoesterase family protein [Paenibacillus ihbetae]|uniref:metallophosphoesterase family protein n=1 Tax=Paenibacillus ihbetae TaxID=1870820 RepID=UPI000C152740|nr:metallophosphoesterase family protein [Paenibacillus ihbetae]